MEGQAEETERNRLNAAKGVTNKYLQGLEDRGAHHFRQNDFKAALRCVDEVIKRDAMTRASMLDRRAAIYIKLGNLDKALTDASNSVRRDQRQAIGYIRLGQILELQGKPEKAIRSYETGIRKADKNDVYYKTLIACREKSVRLAVPATAVDPWSVLPYEIIGIVLSYLAFPDVLSMMRVCKSWQIKAVRRPALWTELDFMAARKYIPFSTLQKYVTRSQGRVRKVTLRRYTEDSKDLIYIVERCKAISDLVLGSGTVGPKLMQNVIKMKQLQRLVLSSQCEIPLDQAVALVGQCQLLEHAEFHAIRFSEALPLSFDNRSMQSLALDTTCQRQNVLELPIFAMNLPNLRHIRLCGLVIRGSAPDYEVDFRKFRALQSLDLQKAYVGRIEIPLKLAHVNVRGTQYLIDPTRESARLCAAAPNTLDISYNRFIVADDLLCTLRGGTTQLTTDHCEGINDLVLAIVFELNVAGQVRLLSLIGTCITDLSVELIAKHCLSLESINLSYTKVTGVGIAALVRKRQRTLKYIYVNNCDRLSSDAVELVRAAGIEISYKNVEATGKAKKVR